MAEVNVGQQASRTLLGTVGTVAADTVAVAVLPSAVVALPCGTQAC